MSLSLKKYSISVLADLLAVIFAKKAIMADLSAIWSVA